MKKRNIIIVATCIITAIACIALTFWGNIKNDGVLTTDAFIGVCTTLIGVCATIIVGFQIVAYLEIPKIKRQMEEIEMEREKMQKEQIAQQEKFQKIQESLQNKIVFIGRNLSNAFVSIAGITNSNSIKSLAYLTSIYCDNIEIENSEITLRKYESLYESLNATNEEDKKALSTQVDKLKGIMIPENIKDYYEIMKLHSEVIVILEKAAKEQSY